MHIKRQFLIGIFWGDIGKKGIFLDWKWGRISDPGDREKWSCIGSVKQKLLA